MDLCIRVLNKKIFAVCPFNVYRYVCVGNRETEGKRGPITEKRNISDREGLLSTINNRMEYGRGRGGKDLYREL